MGHSFVDRLIYVFDRPGYTRNIEPVERSESATLESHYKAGRLHTFSCLDNPSMYLVQRRSALHVPHG